jgi:succinate dehydrogenase/fumarate reductase flavoprotein subunit
MDAVQATSNASACGCPRATVTELHRRHRLLTLQTINHHRGIDTDHDVYTRAAKYPDSMALAAAILNGSNTYAAGKLQEESTGGDACSRRLPGMYHQFMELAGVDITTTPMEVAPTCHYMMGGVRVDAEEDQPDQVIGGLTNFFQ